MRMTFRLRSLLLGMVVVGVTVWLALDLLTSRRRAYYRDRADSYAFGEADVLELIAEKLESARRAETTPGEGAATAAKLRAEAEKLARLAAWHVKMERKYAHAAEHPWDRFPPDGAPP